MKLQFTNGYRPRFDQISRILQYLLSQEDRKKIPRQEIVDILGIPNKQIENLTSMMTGFGLVVPRSPKLTTLGKAIIQGDPYFENLDTLWIIHFTVSSNSEWVVWHRIVNTVIPSHDRISIEYTSKNYFSDISNQFSIRTISEKLPKEVGAVFSSYSRSELSRLNLLHEEGNGVFLRENPVEMSGLSFLYCVLNFRDRISPGSSALNLADICTMLNSPGRVLNLPEYKVRNLLGGLHDRGLVRVEQFADLDQVRLSADISCEVVLSMIYGGEYAD